MEGIRGKRVSNGERGIQVMSILSFLMNLFGKGARKGNITSAGRPGATKKNTPNASPAPEQKTEDKKTAKEKPKRTEDAVPEPVKDTVTGYVRIEKGKRVSTSA